MKNHRANEFTYAGLYRAQNGRCFYCNSRMHKESWRIDNRKGWTRDHFMPFSKGHSLVGNVILSCATCNRNKGSRMPSYGLIERFIELYRPNWPALLSVAFNEGVDDWEETQSLLNRISAWAGNPNIFGKMA